MIDGSFTAKAAEHESESNKITIRFMISGAESEILFDARAHIFTIDQGLFPKFAALLEFQVPAFPTRAREQQRATPNRSRYRLPAASARNSTGHKGNCRP